MYAYTLLKLFLPRCVYSMHLSRSDGRTEEEAKDYEEGNEENKLKPGRKSIHFVSNSNEQLGHQTHTYTYRNRKVVKAERHDDRIQICFHVIKTGLCPFYLTPRLYLHICICIIRDIHICMYPGIYSIWI